MKAKAIDGRAVIGAERRIIAIVRRATETERTDGIGWYASAGDYIVALGHEHGLTDKQSCGAAAAISPGLKWERNLLCFRALVLWHVAGRPRASEPVVETYSYANVRKALAILDGTLDPDVAFPPATSPKVQAFYLALLTRGTCSVACLDGHIANALRDEREALRETAGIRVTERRVWQAAFARASARLGLDVPKVQAIVWLVHKREKDNRIPF